MNRRSCVENVLLGRKPARVPCFPLVDVSYAGTHHGMPMAQLQLDPVLHAAALARCAAELPIDGLYVNLCLSRRQAATAVCRKGTYHVRLDDALDVEFAENDVAAIAKSDIRDPDDPRIERAELYHPGMLETFQAIDEATRREVAVCVGLTGTFSQVGFLLGLENLLLAIVDRPEAVHRALRLRQTAALRQAAEIIAAGARFVWIGEGMASGSLIGRRTYTEFVLPYQQALADEIRRLGGFSLLHVCGNATPSLAAIAESRVDGADIDWLTDWQAAVKILGPRMCLKGNVDPRLCLPGRADELAAACRAALNAVGSVRGLILSTGCLVPRDSTPAAFFTMANVSGTLRVPPASGTRSVPDTF
jgi:uroporphyrinogen-III decarboxylase